MKKIDVILLIILLLSCGTVMAEKKTIKNWIADSNSWHFYNELPPKEKTEIEKMAQEYADYKVSSEFPVMSSAWIKENLPRFRQQAGDNPTSDNVLSLLYMEKIIRDRGKVLAQAAVKYASSDPYLDSSYKSATTAQGSLAHRKEFSRRKEVVVAKLLKSEKIGLWIFYNSKECNLCEHSFKVYDSIIKKYGTPAIIVATDNKEPDSKYLIDVPVNFNSKKAKELNIKSFPAVFAYHMITKEFVQITRGLISEDIFLASVLNAASFAGWLDEETENYINVLYDPYSFSKIDMRSLSTGDISAEDIVNQVKSHMEVLLRKEGN